jgi:hypothetical protein
MIVLHAFDNGKCMICNTEIVTANIPCHKVCDSCANNHKLCEQCGEQFGDGEVAPRLVDPSNP